MVAGQKRAKSGSETLIENNRPNLKETFETVLTSRTSESVGRKGKHGLATLLPAYKQLSAKTPYLQGGATKGLVSTGRVS